MPDEQVFRVDKGLREQPKRYWLTFSVVTIGTVTLLIVGLISLFYPPTILILLIPISLLLLAGLVSGHFWSRTFEVRLVSCGLQITNWGVTKTFRRPVIVSRCIRWSHSITVQTNPESEPDAKILRSTIHLDHLLQRSDRVATIEHCRQFLSPVQQAEVGSAWDSYLQRLLAPPKPPNWGAFLRLNAGCTLAVFLFLYAMLKWVTRSTTSDLAIVWEVEQEFHPALLGLALVGGVMALLSCFMERDKRRRENSTINGSAG